jgi:DNA-binding beta-propeller fold protein YncE
MSTALLQPSAASRGLFALIVLAGLAAPTGALGAPAGHSKRGDRCTPVRALRGPAPFLGSNAVAISRDGNNVYVASSKSNAIAIFERDTSTGRLTQRPGKAGCIAANGRSGCASALGLDHPNSVAVSADGKNVYVGSFFGNAVAVFARNTSTGALTQPADTTGCIGNTPTAGCATGLALAALEGMAISGDGNDVYVATAVSNAVLVLTRDPSTGALSQATDGSGCIVNSSAAADATGAEGAVQYLRSVASRSVSIRERRYKLARYYDADGNVADQWEMYDLENDPLERRNLAYKGYKRTPEQQRQYRRHRRKLARVEKTRLRPLS